MQSRWNELGYHEFEKLVMQILQNEYKSIGINVPKGHSDDGYDASARTSQGLILFEIKLFTRMDSSQRRQVEATLARLAKYDPYEINFILPIRPTAALLDWFKNLGAKYEINLV